MHPWEYQRTTQTEMLFHLKKKKETRNTKKTFMKGKMETGDVGIWQNRALKITFLYQISSDHHHHHIHFRALFSSTEGWASWQELKFTIFPNSSRKLLRIKVTPDLHLTYSKNGGNLGQVLKNIACISILLTKHVKYTHLYLFKFVLYSIVAFKGN